MHQAITGAISDMDDQADEFASEFLLPEAAMRRELTAPLTLTFLAELKAKWGVSIQALIRRAERLGIVTEGQRKYVEKQLVRRGWIRNEPVRIEPEKPRLLTKLSESLYGIPIRAEKVASNTAAPNKLMGEILSAHALQSDIGKTIRSPRTPLNASGLALVAKSK